MYLRNSVKPIVVPRNRPALVMLVTCAILTIGLSVPPGATWLLDATRAATGTRAAPVGPLAERGGN